MKKEVNKTLIGAFILGAVVLSVIGVLVFGGSSLFRSSDQYVIYFTGSVKGLGIGAPVQLKGVNMGKVLQINLVYEPENKSFFNRVVFEVHQKSIQVAGVPKSPGLRKKMLATGPTIDSMIENGLRAKLQIQSIVTGQLLVAFDFYPETPVDLMGFEKDLKELPTLPSDMDALAKTFDTIDFPAIAESIRNAAKGIDQLVNSADLHEAVASVNDTLKRYGQLASNLDAHMSRLSTETTATLVDIRRLVETADGQITPMAAGITDTSVEVRKTVANLNDRLQPVMQNIEDTAASARDAFQQAKVMLSNLTHLSNEDSALVYQIDDTMKELSKAAGALNVLAEYLSRHPEALLRGKQATQGE